MRHCIVYNESLSQDCITASIATVSDSYDNALAATVIGSCKNELIHNRKWDDAVEEKIATFERVHWWNEKSLHQNLGYRTPP
ncbi:transposase [Corynebacterium propinquum]|nr:transposase [Corynebacterium propinquum]